MTWRELCIKVEEKKGDIEGQIFFNLWLSPNNYEEEVPEEIKKEIIEYYNL